MKPEPGSLEEYEDHSEQPQISKLPADLITSRFIYFLLISFILLGEIALITNEGLDIESTLGSLFILSIYSLIFYGLVKMRKWVVTLVLVNASLGLFTQLIGVLSVPEIEGPALFASRVMGIFLALFWYYQITLFSKKRTRQYFKKVTGQH